jgi:uncharacterized protein
MRPDAIPRTPWPPSTTTCDAPADAVLNQGAGSHEGVSAPFRQILLKIHSRCNLACDYCYVYTHADQSWRDRPLTMDSATVNLAAERIAEHAVRHDLGFVTVILHGGEPLLAGAAHIDYVASTIRAAVPRSTHVNLHVQTNGILLNDHFLDVFHRHGIRVGVSLDGGEAANDLHRKGPDGRGSYRSVARGIRLLRSDRYRHLYGGLLCTVQLSTDPLAVYRDLVAFEPPGVDFLLPHGNWTAPPPGRSTDGIGTPYADWLIAVFDEWFAERPQRTGVRLFESIIDLLLGGLSRSEAVGLSPIDLITIETDGAIEQADALKTAGNGLAATGLHITTASFDDALRQPGFRARQAGLAALSQTCRGCPVVRVCGGGLYAHRYQADTGFANPSVYCADLRALIEHIRDRVAHAGGAYGIRTVV